MAESGRRGQAVQRLLSDPNRFLAAVQVGVTLAGFFSAAFGASTLSEPLARGGWARGVQRGPRRHPGPGPRHHRDQLPVARGRRADPQAAGPAAGRGLLAARRRAAQRDRHAVPPGHLAALEVHRRAGPPARRRPEAERRVDQPGGAPRPRGRARVAEQRRAPAHRRGLPRRRARGPRGHDAAHRGRVPRGVDDGQPGGQAGRRLQLVALPGGRPRRGRRHRLRARPRPVPAQPPGRPGRDRGRPRPRGEAAARHQGRARRAQRDAPGEPAPGDRGRRVRRHRRDRHPRGPHRGGHRGDLRRVRRGGRPRRQAAARRPREVDGLLNLDDFTEVTGLRAARRPVRDRRPATCSPSSAGCRRSATRSRSRAARSRSSSSTDDGSPGCAWAPPEPSPRTPTVTEATSRS